MTVLDFVTLTRRGWKTLLLAVVFGLLVAGAYVLLAPKTYQASSNGFISGSGSSVVAGTDQATEQAGSYLPLISSAPVYDRIAKTEGIDPGAIRGHLDASLVAGTTMIQVTATASSPQGAARLANGALSALADVITEIQKAGGASDTPHLKVIPLDNATAPSTPVSPKPKLVLPIGALAGLVLGYIVILLRRALDVRVRAGTDMIELLGTGVLGRVPRFKGKGGVRGGELDRLSAESFRQVRTGLRFSSVDGEVRCVVVTSPNQSEGKSTVAARLAAVIAESGQPTLIIDADLRRPSVARQFDMDGTIGLSEVLSGQVPVQEAVRTVGRENLMVLPAGGTPPNPSEMLGAHAFEALLRELRERFFVVVDAPPVLPVTDALLVGAVADGTLFVVAVGQTRKAEVTAARRLLEQAKSRLLGVVLNKVPVNDRDGGYSYYHNNRSYYTRPESGKRRRDAAKKVTPVPAPHEVASPATAAQARATAAAGRSGMPQARLVEPQMPAPVAPAPAAPTPVTSPSAGPVEPKPVDSQQESPWPFTELDLPDPSLSDQASDPSQLTSRRSGRRASGLPRGDQ